jgi:integrase
MQRVAMALGMADPDTRLALLLGCLAGLRAGEIAALRGENIDLADMTLRVEAGKGGRSRLVPIHQALALELALRPGRGYLFPGLNGGHVMPATIGRRMAKVLRRAGIDGAVGHQTRHSCATWLLRSGAPIEVVAEVMGHASVQTTRGYAALDTSATGKAVRRLRIVA